MSDPKRLLTYYGAFVESALGLEARATEDDGALVFHDDDLVYVVRNTASFNAGLIDMTVCVPITEDLKIKRRVCNAVVRDVPCLRAWVDADGDVVLNTQSFAGGSHLLPRPEVLREVMPQLLGVLRYAAVRVTQDSTLAGIARASG